MQAKDVKVVYKLIKVIFLLVTRQVTSYSSEDKILSRDASTIWKIQEVNHKVTLEFLSTKVSKLRHFSFKRFPAAKRFLLLRSSASSPDTIQSPCMEEALQNTTISELFRQNRFWKLQLYVILYIQSAEMIAHLTQWSAGIFAQRRTLFKCCALAQVERRILSAIDAVWESQTCRAFLWPQNNLPQDVSASAVLSPGWYSAHDHLSLLSLSFLDALCVPKIIDNGYLTCEQY